MEMVHQGIHSLPQYGLCDLLSSHQGNKISVFYDYFEPVIAFYLNTKDAFH